MSVSAQIGPERVTRRLLAWLFTPGPSPAVYVLRMWPVSTIPSILAVAATCKIATLFGHEALCASPRPIAGRFFVVGLLGPALETLLMVPILWVFQRVSSKGFVVAGLSALVWAVFHATESPIRGVGALWGFFVLSAAFLAWRQKSLLAAYWIAFTLHALNNLAGVTVATGAQSGVGWSRAAQLAIAGLMGAGLLIAHSLAADMPRAEQAKGDASGSLSSPAATPLPVNVARASWVCPIVGVGIAGILQHYVGGSAPNLAALLTGLAGCALGIVALFGAVRDGAKRIVAPALTGILLSGCLLLVWLFTVFYGPSAFHPAAAGRP